MTGINPSRPPDGATGAGQQARQQASRVGHQATQAGGQMAHAAAEQGGHIAHEARQQMRNLTGEANTQLRGQAHAQKQRAADGLRGFGRELSSMAECSQDSGMAAQAVRRAAHAAEQAAGWIEHNEPAAMMDDVRAYARRHPGTFLAGAAVAGLLFGRLTRSLTGGGDGRGAPSEAPQPGAAGVQPGEMQAGQRPYERTVTAPYEAESPYVGASRVRSSTPPGRPEGEIPGGVAP
ncbi:hypothetical protein GA0070609_5383 [Micromonospora echinaurantiaca]|uniref:DUF3618 domain-containing protein n=1 Tax=Micromonospora echinaurantiaca TaxID=47857 RepID=A0A1C5K3P0_9ACTN|nr:hypothetical protein [Micromonospora echinaurantiaca]SCG77380.1 hypothetical protein GA0070609_5383 [Micromonospora echinaurantiaca]